LDSVVKGSTDHNGFEAFKAGWMATFEMDEWSLERLGLSCAWFANVAFGIALLAIVFGFRRYAVLVAACACLMSMSVLPHWWPELLKHAGYWFWWGSMIAAVFSAVFILPRPRNPFVDDFGPLKNSGPSNPTLP